ncbi:MAG: hypothetical protein MI674_06580 [Cytophagales bacterium]|nr:hypothetical protein [Cytophagales bacterium]
MIGINKYPSSCEDGVFYPTVFRMVIEKTLVDTPADLVDLLTLLFKAGAELTELYDNALRSLEQDVGEEDLLCHVVK